MRAHRDGRSQRPPRSRCPRVTRAYSGRQLAARLANPVTFRDGPSVFLVAAQRAGPTAARAGSNRLRLTPCSCRQGQAWSADPALPAPHRGLVRFHRIQRGALADDVMDVMLSLRAHWALGDGVRAAAADHRGRTAAGRGTIRVHARPPDARQDDHPRHGRRITEGGYLIGRRTRPGRPALTGKARGGRPHRLHWRNDHSALQLVMADFARQLPRSTGEP